MDENRYLPRNPISRLLGIDALIIFVISEILQPVEDHDDSTLAISTTSTIALAVLLGLIGAPHL